jgi:O-antigen ligase
MKLLSLRPRRFLAYAAALLPLACVTSGSVSEGVIVLFVLLGAATIVRDPEYRAELLREPLLRPTVALVSALTLAATLADPYPKVTAVTPILVLLVVPLGAVLFRLDRQAFRTVTRAAALAVAIAFVASVIQVFGIHPLRNAPDEMRYWRVHPVLPIHRATGLFHHPIHFGATMALFAFWWFAEALRQRRSYVPALLALLALVTAIMSFSKSVWLGMAAAVATLLVVALRGRARWILLGIASVVVVGMLSVPAVRERGPYFLPDKQTQRLRYWGLAWQMFRKAPILGEGPRSFRTRAALYLDESFVKRHMGALDPHNTYLEILSGAGLVGFAAFLWWLLAAGVPLFRGAHAGSPQAAAGLAAWMFLVVAGTFDHYLSSRITTPVLLLLWASGLAIDGMHPLRNASSAESGHRRFRLFLSGRDAPGTG